MKIAARSISALPPTLSQRTRKSGAPASDLSHSRKPGPPPGQLEREACPYITTVVSVFIRLGGCVEQHCHVHVCRNDDIWLFAPVEISDCHGTTGVCRANLSHRLQSAVSIAQEE